jgi:hypothetical protein
MVQNQIMKKLAISVENEPTTNLPLANFRFRDCQLLLNDFLYYKTCQYVRRENDQKRWENIERRGGRNANNKG